MGMRTLREVEGYLDMKLQLFGSAMRLVESSPRQ